MHKGIDQKFVHYGIRREDLALIAAICEKNEIDFDWMSENILRAYHGKKVDVIEIAIVIRKASSRLLFRK